MNNLNFRLVHKILDQNGGEGFLILAGFYLWDEKPDVKSGALSSH